MPLILDSQFNWGPVRTGVEQMRSFVSQSTKGIQTDIAKMFTPAGIGGFLSISLLEQGISKVVEYGAHIADLGKRFAVSTTTLQQFGNVAEHNGSSLDGVAMALNRLDVAREKALGGNKQMIDSFEGLNVTAEDLQHLSLPELLLKIGSSSMNAADMTKVLGRSGTQLRETLRTLADGTEKLSDAIDPKHIAALKKADVAYTQLWQNIKIKGGDALGFLVDFFDKKYKSESEYLIKSGQLKVSPNEAGKFGGLGYDKPIGPGLPGMPGEEHKGSGALDEGDTAGILKETQAERQRENLAEKIAKIESESAQRRMSDQQKLNDLQQKNVELYYQQAAAAGDETKEAEARLAYLESEKQIEELSAKIEKEKAEYVTKWMEAREKAGASADQELAKEKAGNEILEAELSGEHERAELLKVALEYDEKIAKAQKALADAEQQGFTDVANTNRELVKQLELEKGNAIAAKEKAQAEKAAEEAAALHAEDMQQANELRHGDLKTAKDQLADLEETRKENDLIAAGQSEQAQKLHDAYDWQIKIDDATDRANEAWEKMNLAYSQGKKILGDQYAELAKINEATTRELELQKQISEQRKNQQDWAKGTQKLVDNLSTIDPAQLSTPVGKNGLRAAPGDPATILATNPYTGVIDEGQLAYWQKYFQTHALGGQIANLVAGRQQQFLTSGGFGNPNSQPSSYLPGSTSQPPIMPTLMSMQELLEQLVANTVKPAGMTSRG